MSLASKISNPASFMALRQTDVCTISGSPSPSSICFLIFSCCSIARNVLIRHAPFITGKDASRFQYSINFTIDLNTIGSMTRSFNGIGGIKLLRCAKGMSMKSPWTLFDNVTDGGIRLDTIHCHDRLDRD